MIMKCEYSQRCFDRIAVLMTCHNRREKTLACLQSVFSQELPSNVTIAVYLVDDGCSDGTGTAVRAEFPEVRVLQGDGSLYWCGGMRLAWDNAMIDDYDAYLWLNDDTRIYENTLRAMLDTAETIRENDRRDGIVVGSIRDPETGEHTYGGVKRIAKTLGFRLVAPDDKPQQCDTMNGNCVLVPREVFRVIGNLSEKFTHAISDTDYGLRAQKAGFNCWVTAEYVGECGRNPIPNWRNPDLSVRNRLNNLRDTKGLPPRQWAELARCHVGMRWPIYVVKLWLRALFPGIWKKLRGGSSE